MLTLASLVLLLRFVLADLIDQIKLLLKAELEQGPGDPNDASAPQVSKEVFNQSENQLKNTLLRRFAATDSWGAAGDKETLSLQCVTAVKNALDALAPDQHSFDAMLQKLRPPAFVLREIQSLRDLRLSALESQRLQAQKEKDAKEEEQRRREAEQRQKEEAAEVQPDSEKDLMAMDTDDPAPAAKLNEGDAVDALAVLAPEVNPSLKEKLDEAAALPAEEHKQDSESAAAASVEAQEDDLEARVKDSVDTALRTSRFLCANAKDNAVSGDGGELHAALQQLAATLEGRDPALGADYLFLDAPKQSANYADHFERRFDARDLQTLVSNLVTLLRPGGILAVLCDTDQQARLWSYAQDDLALSVWVVAALNIVCSPDSLPKGNQHVQGPLDVKSVSSQQRVA